MGMRKREFAVLNKQANQWFRTPSLMELSAVANKAMQFTAFPIETKEFFISEIQGGSFIGRDGEMVSAKDLSATNLVGGVIGHNILTGEIQEFESVLAASKCTGVTYGAVQYRACVHSVAPWPTKNWCFKWASSDTTLREFTQEEIDTFTDKENIYVPVKFRHVDSSSHRAVLATTITLAAKEIGCSVSAAMNALRIGRGRVGDYQLWYLK